MNDEPVINTVGDVIRIIDDLFANLAKELIAVRTFTVTMIQENALQYQEVEMLKRELEERL